MRRAILVLAAGLAAFAVSGCRIVKAPAAGSAADPDAAKIAAVVDETYAAKLVPLIGEKAAAADILVPAIAADLGSAGRQYGRRGAGEEASWTFAVTGQGVVVAENRESRAARLDVDVTGDGVADLALQLGPVVKGTALRDVAPFYDFTDFRDQIQFAQLARALNDRATAGLALPAGALAGKTVAFAGAFSLHAAKDPILVAPVTLSVLP